MTDRERSRSPDPAPAPVATDDSNGGPPPAAPLVTNGAAPDNGGGGGGVDADGVKLYVGNLDYATDETKLREEFGQFGVVTDVFLPVERGTSRPRGFGFVTMSQRSEAENAISKMDQAQVDGRTIRVNESRPKGSAPRGPPGGAPGGGGFNAAGTVDVKLYVGNLSFDTNEDSVRQLFEQYGAVSDCFLPTDRDSGKMRGFCFVTMPAAVAEDACTKVNGYELDGRTLRVNEAQPKGMSGGGPPRGGGGGYGDSYGGGQGGGGGYGGGGGGGYGGGGGGYGGGSGGGGYSGGGGGYSGGGGGYSDRGGGGGGGYSGGGGGGYDDRRGGGGGGYSGGGGGGYDDRGGGGGGRGGGGGEY